MYRQNALKRFNNVAVFAEDMGSLTTMRHKYRFPDYPNVGSLADASMSFAWKTVFQGEVGYMITVFDMLVAIDIGDQWGPAVLGSFDMTALGTGSTDHVVDGNYVYVIFGGYKGVAVIDVTDPTDISIVGSVQSDTYFGAQAGIVKVGNYLYCVSASEYLVVVDVSDPTDPTIVNQITDPALSLADSLIHEDGYLYIAVEINNEGLTIVSIADPENPVIVGSLDDGRLGGASGVAKAGRYVYLACAIDNTFAVIDVEDKTSPVVVGVLRNDKDLNFPYTIALNGNLAYVACTGDMMSINGTLATIDISKPHDPVLACRSTAGATFTSVDVKWVYFTSSVGGYPGWYAIVTDMISGALTVFETCPYETEFKDGSIAMHVNGNDGAVTILGSSAELNVLHTGVPKATFATWIRMPIGIYAQIITKPGQYSWYWLDGVVEFKDSWDTSYPDYNAPIEDAEWHFTACVIDGADSFHFLDGVKGYQFEISPVGAPSANVVTMSHASQWDPFDLYKFIVLPDALTVEELIDLMNGKYIP